MKEIKIYLDLVKIEEETGRKFDVENEYSDNFLQWIEFLAHYLATHNKNYRKEQYYKATELHDILKNCYSEWDIKHKGIYKIGNEYYTINELRQGYKTITGLDNDNELSDRQVFEYMSNALSKE